MDYLRVEATYFEQIYEKLQFKTFYEVLNILNVNRAEIVNFVKFSRDFRGKFFFDNEKHRLCEQMLDVLVRNNLHGHFNPIMTNGDGNCLYRAVSICMFGEDSFYKMIRIATVFILSENFVYFNKIMNGSNTQQLIVNTATDSHFGAEYEHQAISMLCLRPLIIFSNGPACEFFPDKCAMRHEREPMVILFKAAHFTALIEKKKRKKFEMLRNLNVYFDSPFEIYFYY